MADHHDAKDDSKRNTYRHTLGRELTPGSSAEMQWGPEYRRFHQLAWAEVYDLLVPGGYFLLNVKDHIRKGVKQPVSAWHKAACLKAGFQQLDHLLISVTGNRQGENGQVRVDAENLYVMQKPWQEIQGVKYSEGALR